MSDHELIEFLQWCLPKLQLRWPGFRKVRRTVRKRLVRRIRSLGLGSLTEYRRTLESDPGEWSALDTICRIPISRFYRDRSVYDALSSHILPDCARRARLRRDNGVNVLSAGCASGEEPYSVSLLWHMRVAEHFPASGIDILAADIDAQMLKRAMEACYSSGSLKDLPRDLVQSGFEQRGDIWCVLQRYRTCVHFVQCDLRKEVLDGPFDLVLCRNTAFTYFAAEARAHVAAWIHAALRPGGYLVVGAHETLPAAGQKWAQSIPGCPVFRKADMTS